MISARTFWFVGTTKPAVEADKRWGWGDFSFTLEGGAFCSLLLHLLLAGAASLAPVRMSFPLVPWATFFSGCLGNQPLLLEGEEGPKSDKKKKKR